MRRPYPPYSRLFRLAARIFRYFLFSLLGLVLFGILLAVFGGWDILKSLLSSMVFWLCLGRIALTIAFLMLVAIVVESLRSGR